MAGQAHLLEPFMTHREGPVSMMRKNRWHRGKWRPTSWGFRQGRPCVPRTRRSSKSWNLSRTKSAGCCPGRWRPKRPSDRLDLPRPRVDDDDRNGDPGHVRRGKVTSSLILPEPDDILIEAGGWRVLVQLLGNGFTLTCVLPADENLGLVKLAMQARGREIREIIDDIV